MFVDQPLALPESSKNLMVGSFLSSFFGLKNNWRGSEQQFSFFCGENLVFRRSKMFLWVGEGGLMRGLELIM